MIPKTLLRICISLSVLAMTVSCSEKIPELYGNYIIKTRWVDTVSMYHEGGLDSIRLSVRGTDSPLELISDTSGMFHINDLRWGVYALELSREGFTTQIFDNLKLYGAEDDTLTQTLYTPLYQLNTRKIKNFHLLPSETVPNWNNYEVPDEVFNQLLPNQALWIFIDTLPDVSYNQYLQYDRGTAKFDNSGLRRNVQLFIQLEDKTCYAVAYISSAIYGVEGYTGSVFKFGTPSDIFTFQPTQ